MSDNELAQKGHDKAKRYDLQTVGLALMIAPVSVKLFTPLNTKIKLS